MGNLYILKGGVRIFRPCEVKRLIDSIPKVEYKDKFEALLYTGARFNELKWLYTHKNAFDGEVIHMPSLKPSSRYSERYIRLNANGKRAVSYFLRGKRNLPSHPGWEANLRRWCVKAGIDPVGVSCKSTRKTWESWLVTMYPNNVYQIFLSQGHTDKVALEYYLMLPFSDDDKKEMRYYTDGWL